jgi:hypothetical protein
VIFMVGFLGISMGLAGYTRLSLSKGALSHA